VRPQQRPIGMRPSPIFTWSGRRHAPCSAAQKALVEGLIGNDRPLDPVVGLANKAPEHAARLAACLAYFNGECDQGGLVINADRMAAGIILVSEPSVLSTAAWNPKAVFSQPVVLSLSANVPTWVFCIQAAAAVPRLERAMSKTASTVRQ
jgi:hypothetical protein